MIIQTRISRIKSSPLAKDSFWAIFGNAMGKGLSLLAGIIVARLLGVDIYGEYGVVKSTLAYVAAFSTFGLGYTSTKYIAQTDKTETGTIRSIIKSSMGITIVTSVIMAASLWILAENVATESHLVSAIRFTSLIVVFNAVNTTQIGLLSGFKDFKAIAINNMIVGITTFILSVILSYFFSLDGAIWSLFITTVLNCVLNHIVLHRHNNKSLISTEHTVTKNVTKDLLKFSLPISLQECVYASANWLRMIVLVNFAGYAEMGLYTATNQWFVVMLFIPGVLRNVILSHLSSTLEDKRQHDSIFYTMLKINLVSTIVPASFIALLSPVIGGMYGDTFVGINVVLILAVLASIFGCMAGIYTQEFISRGKNWIVLIGYIIRDYGALLLILPFMFKYGQLYGASIVYIAMIVTHIVYCVILHIMYKKDKEVCYQ